MRMGKRWRDTHCVVVVTGLIHRHNMGVFAAGIGGGMAIPYIGGRNVSTGCVIAGR